MFFLGINFSKSDSNKSFSYLFNPINHMVNRYMRVTAKTLIKKIKKLAAGK
jgi:hypothetical protein